MYEIGELIVYGNEGVCRVEKIGASESPGANKDRLYYTLIPLARNGKVTVPVDSSVFSRPVISREEAEEIMSCVETVEVEVFNDRNLKLLTELDSNSSKSNAISISHSTSAVPLNFTSAYSLKI